MKKRKLLIGLIICSMILYQHTLCSAAFVGIDDSDVNIVEQEKEEQPFYSYMEKYKELVSIAEDWRTADGEYQCPVKRDDLCQLDTWEKKHAACQIPEEILQSVDTRELLELVFDFPYLHDMQYSNSYYEGIQYYAGEFNGLYELINRPDFYETVVMYYDNLNIPLHQKNNLSELLPENPTTEDYIAIDDEEEQNRIDDDLKMEAIINFCIAVIGGMTENIEKDEKINAGRVLSKKFSEIEISEYNDGGIITKDMLNQSSWADKNVTSSMGISNNIQRSATDGPKTKGGLKVDFTPVSNRSPVSDKIKNDVLEEFTGWDVSTGKSVVRVLGGTTGYNCHNYAWLYYDTDYKDKYWKKGYINKLSNSYYKDNAYGQSNNVLSDYQIAANGDNHSVVVVKSKVTYRDKSGVVRTDVLVKSKWGPSGALVEHPLGLMPSAYLGTYQFYC